MLDSVQTAVTVGSNAQVVKPANMVIDRLLTIDTGSGRKVVHRRSRAWIEMYNVDAEEGVPKYYSDYNEADWFLAPIPNGALEIVVHGYFRPASIVDGADGGTTWFSTRVPDLLFLACSIEACEFLKFWAHKAANEADLEAKAARYLGAAASLQRSDVEDIVGNRQNVNKPSTQEE
jgi:hypothetical protein